MARILIVYGSSEGQTGKIAARIAERLRDQKHEVEVVDGAHLPANYAVEDFDAAILGAPDYRVRQLESRILGACAFGVLQRLHGSGQPAAGQATAGAKQEREIFHETGWRPRLAPTFAGALHYRRYNFLLRFLMKRITRSEGVGTDTSRAHEYTDWAAVSRFTDEFASLL